MKVGDRVRIIGDTLDEPHNFVGYEGVITKESSWGGFEWAINVGPPTEPIELHFHESELRVV